MPERPTSRREFLHGRSAAEALQGVGDAVFSEPLPPIAPETTLTLTRRAMACDFQVRLNASATQNETEAALAALDVVERIEDRLTVYRDEGEVVDINRAAADGPVAVAEDLFELLQFAGELYVATNGAFDITSGPLSKAWGFSRRSGRVPSEGQLATALEHVGWPQVQLDAEALTVEFSRPGVEVNFNNIGKGFALDRAARVLHEGGAEHFMLNGGRSTIVARGSLGGAAGGGWGVGVRHPLRPQQRIAECQLRDAAFSTSGSATQCFVAGGKRYGHLIDPRTGWPAEGTHSVSVVAPTGAAADALSTAFYVMGFEATADFAASLPGVQALFVLPGDRAGGVAVRGIGLDPECWRLESPECLESPE